MVVVESLLVWVACLSTLFSFGSRFAGKEIVLFCDLDCSCACQVCLLCFCSKIQENVHCSSSAFLGSFPLGPSTLLNSLYSPYITRVLVIDVGSCGGIV